MPNVFKYLFEFLSLHLSPALEVVCVVTKRVRNMIKDSRGAVLIEFAACIPVLILLLLGLADIFNMAKWYDRTRLASHVAVALVQHITGDREDKTLTEEDMKHIAKAVNLSVYPTGVENKEYLPHSLQVGFGYRYNNSNSWWRRVNIKPGSDTWVVSQSFQSKSALDLAQKLVEYKKMIVYVSVYSDWDNLYGKENYVLFNSVKKMFGLSLLEPTNDANGDPKQQRLYFSAVSTFSPRRNLVSSTAPK